MFEPQINQMDPMWGWEAVRFQNPICGIWSICGSSLRGIRVASRAFPESHLRYLVYLWFLSL